MSLSSMAQMAIALEDDASNMVLDPDIQSRLDRTTAIVEDYREKLQKASTCLDSNNAEDSCVVSLGI